MYTVSEVINELEKQICEAQKQIAQLKRFDALVQEGITEQVYHELCETDMRYTDELGKAIETVLPCLHYKSRNSNSFVYDTDNSAIQVRIPNTLQQGIDIVVDKYCANEEIVVNTIERRYQQNDSYRKAIQLAEQFLSTTSLIDKAKLVFPTYKSWFAVLHYSFARLRKNYNERFVQILLDAREKEKNLLLKKQADIEEALTNRKLQQESLLVYAKLLLEWTQVVYVCEYCGSSCYIFAEYRKTNDCVIFKEIRD
mgnify:CR=1 FL=1